MEHTIELFLKYCCKLSDGSELKLLSCMLHYIKVLKLTVEEANTAHKPRVDYHVFIIYN